VLDLGAAQGGVDPRRDTLLASLDPDQDEPAKVIAECQHVLGESLLMSPRDIAALRMDVTNRRAL
jgi:hypothetical protein